MSNNPFAAPATPTGIDWSEQNGKLLLIEPTAVETGIPTSLGEKDAVRAYVTVITGPDSADVYEDCLIFPRVLQGQVRSRIGQKVLGRLGQGVAKPGQNAPWMLLEATADDIAKGTAYLEAREARNKTFTKPAHNAGPSAAEQQTNPQGASVPF